MGLAKGIWMMDVHTHVKTNAEFLGETSEADDSATNLYYMDRYDVDMCVLTPSILERNTKVNAAIAKRYPNRFIATCNDMDAQLAAILDGVPWTIEASVKEIVEQLETGLYKGIGESVPRDRTRKTLITWEERLDQMCAYFELARKYKFPINWHTGVPIALPANRNFDMARTRAHPEMFDNGNPLLAHELAALYPDVPILFLHGGVEASGYYLDDYEKILNVAASHHNVFICCGSWWAELYEKALKDPNIGAKKLVWACAYGQNNQQQFWMPGCVPETAPCTLTDPSLPVTEGSRSGLQTDIWGWSLRELGRLNIPQDDLNLILGGNAAWLYGAKLPLPYDRMFKKVNRGFEYTCMKTILE